MSQSGRLKLPSRSQAVADRHHLGMRGRVVGRGHPVPALGDDLAVAHDHGAEWAAVIGAHFFERDGDGALHEVVVAHLLVAPSRGGRADKEAKSGPLGRPTCRCWQICSQTALI